MSNTLSQADVLQHWAGDIPPRFTHDAYSTLDAAYLQANSDQELLDLLPTLLQMHTAGVPVLLVCDEKDRLDELTQELDLVTANTSIDGQTASGILYGILQRQDEISILRSKVGLMSTMRLAMQDDMAQLHNDLESAATLQQEVMSSDTEPLHGMYFDTLWRPTGVVSGDMYDITKLDQDHISFFIADSIGHGVPAAMFAMALSKTLVTCRKNQNGTFAEPSAVLSALNKSILDRSANTARFATAMYGVINCKNKTLTLAGAGHPPALWLRTSNKPQLLDSKGPLLGIFEDAIYEQQKISLSANDRVVFYSDGFEDVLKARSSNSSLPSCLQAICDFGKDTFDIVGSIGNYLDRNMPHSDDLTMLCLHASDNSVELAA